MDPDFRPETYFRPQRLDRYRVSRVKGTVVRNNLQALMDSGQTEAVAELLEGEACSPEGLHALEAVHPMFMGGNYLPNLRVGEVEIARIAIESTTGDVTAVYARKVGGRIHYRVVDEYEGKTIDGEVTRTSTKPLSLRALVDYFLQAWSLTDVLDWNFEGDSRGAMEFFRGSSGFYPDFDALCRQRVSEHFRSLEGDPEPGDTCPCCGTFNATPADQGCVHRVAWRWDGQTEVFGVAATLERAYREMNSRLEYAEAGGSKAAGPRGEGLLRLAADGADIGDVLVDLVGVRLGDGWGTKGMLGGSGENLYLDDPASLEGWAAECDALCREV